MMLDPRAKQGTCWIGEFETPSPPTLALVSAHEHWQWWCWWQLALAAAPAVQHIQALKKKSACQSSVDFGGAPVGQAVMATELGEMLRLGLGVETKSRNLVRSHSLKTTMLSWMAKFGVPLPFRRTMGHHLILWALPKGTVLRGLGWGGGRGSGGAKKKEEKVHRLSRLRLFRTRFT